MGTLFHRGDAFPRGGVDVNIVFNSFKLFCRICNPFIFLASHADRAATDSSSAVKQLISAAGTLFHRRGGCRGGNGELLFVVVIISCFR